MRLRGGTCPIERQGAVPLAEASVVTERALTYPDQARALAIADARVAAHNRVEL
jgi:hypothetical protein